MQTRRFQDLERDMQELLMRFLSDETFIPCEEERADVERYVQLLRELQFHVRETSINDCEIEYAGGDVEHNKSIMRALGWDEEIVQLQRAFNEMVQARDSTPPSLSTAACERIIYIVTCVCDNQASRDPLVYAVPCFYDTFFDSLQLPEFMALLNWGVASWCPLTFQAKLHASQLHRLPLSPSQTAKVTTYLS